MTHAACIEAVSAQELPRQGLPARHSRAIAALVCTIISGGIVPSTTLASGELIQGTLNLCRTLGEEQDSDQVNGVLTDLGWTVGESQDTTADLLFWVLFASAFTFNETEGVEVAAKSEELERRLGYMIVNSSFMSASILGNSAMPPNQPNYTHGKYRLALIGVGYGKGYCVLSGPVSIVDEVKAIPGFVERWPDAAPRSDWAGVSSVVGEADGIRYFASIFDRDALSSLYSSTDIVFPETTEKFDPGIFDASPEAIIHISSIRPQ